MFEPRSTPRVFGIAPGRPFAKDVAEGIVERCSELPPEDIARVEILVNSGRMGREVNAALSQNQAMLLPRLRPITSIGHDFAMRDVPPAVSSLRTRLELSQFVSALLDAEPDLAPRKAIYDLADSLALLLSELHDEGIPPSALMNLTVQDSSGHWKRNLKFIQLIERYFGDALSPLAEARQRTVVERLVDQWAASPPDHPILIVGSTGSRGTTALLMEAVAVLPQGAVILPGFDFHQPEHVWHELIHSDTPNDDHPQYRYAHLLNRLNVGALSVEPWKDMPAPCPSRNALVSLALRPAPVTDQWLAEGPGFERVRSAMQDVDVIETPSPQSEATAISLAIRGAIEEGQTVALITPDRVLTRQVTASLDRWGIEPDDSAGEPLSQTAPGRLLRQVAAMLGRKLALEELIVLLKHPLVLSGSDLRGMHLLWTRELELWARKKGPAFPDESSLRTWASDRTKDDGRRAWMDWVCGWIQDLDVPGDQPLASLVEKAKVLACQLVAGPDGVADGLWARAAGKQAKISLAELEREAVHGGTMGPRDFENLLRAVLSRAPVNEIGSPRPDVRIFGTLEARVQSSDVVILAGLNEGVWPAQPAPDQWFSRDMRRKIGLTSPEQRIGLSAHDFQIGLGAPRVILTRAVRDGDAQTVASRWLNRLFNLLSGMSKDGADALSDARARGSMWLRYAELLDRPDQTVPLAKRPSPRPPVRARPRKLSVTRIQKLILDPYSIYAENILRLSPVDPLRRSADAALRGTIIHKILERFVDATRDDPTLITTDLFLSIARQTLDDDVPWPAARRLWQVRVEKTASRFIQSERERRISSTPLKLEVRGSMAFQDLDFMLVGTADRVDRSSNGTLVLYDYKTGSIPSQKTVKTSDRQLMLEAMMLQAGAFENIHPGIVTQATYIGLGPQNEDRTYEIGPEEIKKVTVEFCALISEYKDARKGFTSLRTGKQLPFSNPFDHLARYGEWEMSDLPQGEDLS